MDSFVSLFYSPPPFPDVAGGLLVRWTGREQYVKDSLLAFYAAGFKDGFVTCAVACVVIYAVCQLVKGLIK